MFMCGSFWRVLLLGRIWNNNMFWFRSVGAFPPYPPILCFVGGDVDGVCFRERVLDNVIASKGLPPEIAKSKIDNTNLFLRAMGLDAGMLS